MSPPLDLKAIEANVSCSCGWATHDPTHVADVVMLLAHVRALRAALAPFARWAEIHVGDEEDDARAVNLSQYGVGDTWYAATQQLVRGDLRRAATVLAQAQD